MPRTTLCYVIFSVITQSLFVLFPLRAVSAAQFTLSTVLVGDVGNGNDFSGFGAVKYDYRIGTTEVTNAQYTAFLNEKAKSDPFELYNVKMGTDPRSGIARSGASGNFVYTTQANMGDKPVNYVSWYDAIRFANWLNNGQGNGDTESGAYTLLGGTAIPTNGDLITRNIDAKWFLASENEWYKAAYYQPASKGGDSDSYWFYPTRSNSTPTLAAADLAGNIINPGANVANYSSGADWNGRHGNLTTVGGAGSLSNSYYGTSDQGGNVTEWVEAPVSGIDRITRGGHWSNSSSILQGTSRGPYYAWIEVNYIGFRVATVPEMNSGLLSAVACVAIWVLRNTCRAAHRSLTGRQTNQRLKHVLR